ncbi:MAG: hypothetical protein LBJ01_08045 [Tannerella sp.]|jgi:hypothetical protein|nr:hypothetical protein [Tannerella sp.]
MTEDQNRRISALDGKINELLALCDRQKTDIGALTLKLEQEKTAAQQVREEFQALKTKHRDLLTAHIISAGPGDDVKSARKRLVNLVREVDACINYITLLNG